MKIPHRKIILIVGFAAVAFATVAPSIPQGETQPNAEAKTLLEEVYSNPASVSATETLRIGLQSRATANKEAGITEKAVITDITLTKTDGSHLTFKATGTYQIRGGKTPIDLPIEWEFTARKKARGSWELTELSEEAPPMITPTLTLEKLGYDSYGNNPNLLAPFDKERIERGDYSRISGELICEHCSAPFRNHPQVQGALWLRRGCPNLLLKL